MGWAHNRALPGVSSASVTRGVSLSKCSAPPEDSGGPAAFMENRWQYEAVGSRDSREALERLIDDMDEEDWGMSSPKQLADQHDIE